MVIYFLEFCLIKVGNQSRNSGHCSSKVPSKKEPGGKSAVPGSLIFDTIYPLA
jgi:hypothetical protein